MQDVQKNRLTATFRDKSLESAYQSYARQHFTSKDRVMFYAAVATYFLYLVVDYFTLQNARFEIMTLRTVMSVLALGVIAFTYTECGKRYIQFICFIIILSGGFSIATMIAMEGSVSPPYYIGLIMIAMVMTTLVRISFTLASTSLVLLYVTFAIAIQTLPWSIDVLAAYFFMFNCFLLTMITSYILELSRRDEYVQYMKNVQYSEQLQVMVDDANHSIKRKNAVLNALTHVFKTPLHQIIGYAQILETEALGEHSHAEYRDYSASIHNAGRNMLHLVQRLLRYSRLDSGVAKANMQKTSTRELIDCALSRLHEQIEAKQLKIAEPDQKYQLLGDGTLLEQLTYELLLNAIEAAPEGSQIDISTENSNGKTMITIADKGEGIDLDRIEEIENTLDRTEDFLGISEKISLGITLAKKIVEIHGGGLEFSHGESGGTVVKICLPESNSSHAEKPEEKDHSTKMQKAS